MFKSFTGKFASVSASAMLLIAGGAFAADAPSIKSIDSEQMEQIVREQERTQNRFENQERNRLTEYGSAEDSNAARKQVQSKQQKQYKHQNQSQSQSQNRQRVMDAGSRGMGVGGGGRGMAGGGRR